MGAEPGCLECVGGPEDGMWFPVSFNEPEMEYAVIRESDIEHVALYHVAQRPDGSYYLEWFRSARIEGFDPANPAGGFGVCAE